MKNFFSKLSSLTKKISNGAKEKFDDIGTGVRNKIAAVLTGTMVAVSSSAMAAEGEWVKVDVRGMGPREFAVKHFGTEDWKNLKDKEGNYIVNPTTDFKYGKEYTLVIREDKVKKEAKKLPSVVAIPEKKREVEKEENPILSSETYILTNEIIQSKFNIEAYKSAVAGFESSGKYTARNDKKGKEEGIDINKWAFGKYQFTVGTLKRYGVNLTKNGILDEKKVKYFLGNKELQEELMNRYIGESIHAIASNEKIHKSIVSGHVSIPALLAKGHIAGHGSLDQSWGGKDWLGTPVRVYAKKIEKAYHTMVAANDSNGEVTTVSSIETQVPELVVASLSRPTVEKVAELGVVQSANDSYIDENVAELPKVKKTSPIMKVSQKVESKVDSVLLGMNDFEMRESIERKLGKPYESKIDALYANLYHYDMLAINAEKEIRNAIGYERERLIADMQAARKTANSLRIIISKLEGEYLQKVA